MPHCECVGYQWWGSLECRTPDLLWITHRRREESAMTATFDKQGQQGGESTDSAHALHLDWAQHGERSRSDPRITVHHARSEQVAVLGLYNIVRLRPGGRIWAIICGCPEWEYRVDLIGELEYNRDGPFLTVGYFPSMQEAQREAESAMASRGLDPSCAADASARRRQRELLKSRGLLPPVSVVCEAPLGQNRWCHRSLASKPCPSHPRSPGSRVIKYRLGWYDQPRSEQLAHITTRDLRRGSDQS